MLTGHQWSEGQSVRPVVTVRQINGNLISTVDTVHPGNNRVTSSGSCIPVVVNGRHGDCCLEMNCSRFDFACLAQCWESLAYSDLSKATECIEDVGHGRVVAIFELHECIFTRFSECR